MVNVNLSEEEQVEALKKWWRENGRSVVGGVVIGLGAVFGWRYWVEHQDSKAQQASIQLAQLQQSVATGNSGVANKQAQTLIENYQGTPYAIFAALNLAKVKMQAQDGEGAVAQLKWALENASDPSLQQVVRARMARILVSEGKLSEAQQVVDGAAADSFRGEFAELRGDIARARGDHAAARAAYQEALDNQVSNSAYVQMKLDDLSPAANG
ncbi:MAG: tetratricopeptide repeat protein [Gammaproteobacteria bacterium]|nr:tetratricopeptide repeat protein [Gammaproteobacteria bacterium]